MSVITVVTRIGSPVRAVGIDEMMGTGRIAEFDANGGATWEEYVERIELSCAVNKLTTDAEKRAVLLSCCGQEMYSLIGTLVKSL